MRKILFILVSILLLICTVFVIANGIKIGSFEIWGVRDIVAQDEVIDEKNDKLTELINITYPAAVYNLDKDAKTLETTKAEYENQAVLLADSKYYGQTEQYKIEFLWTKIGNYAKVNHVEINMKVINSTTTGLYDLNFAVTGLYSDVTQFIYDIENDSKLGFKIEDFAMTSSGDNNVQGTFSCKEIRIDVKSVDEASGTSNKTSTDTATENEKETNNTTNGTTNSTTNGTTNTNSSATGNNTTSTTNGAGTSSTTNVNSGTTGGEAVKSEAETN